MKMRIKKTDNTLIVLLEGEIDHHSASGMREKIDREIIKASPSELLLDFSGISFMDSSGVGLVIGRYALAKNLGCSLAVCGLKDRDKKILMMSGMQNKIEFR